MNNIVEIMSLLMLVFIPHFQKKRKTTKISWPIDAGI